MNAPLPATRVPDWTKRLDDYIQSVAWSPNGTSLVAALSSGPLVHCDTANGDVQRTWPGHDGGTFRAAFSPLVPVLASVGSDGTARFWVMDQDAPLAVVRANTAWVEQLAWAPDGSLCAVGAGKEVMLLHPSGEMAHRLGARKSTVTALTWRSDSRVLAGAAYGEVARWDVKTGKSEASLPWKTSLISVAWSPDGRWVVAGTQEQTVQIWELPYRPGEELAMSGYSAKVRELAWHKASRFLATGGGEEVMVWDCAGRGPAGSTPRILAGHHGKVTALAYPSASHWLASGAEDGRILFWNAGKSTEPLARVEVGSPVTSLAWSKDDRRLAYGCEDGSIGVVTVPA